MLSADRAAQVLDGCTTRARRVGVFGTARPDEIGRIVREARLDVVQLHADPTPDDVAAVRGETEAMVWAVVRVTDTGPGIDATEQAAIFEAYYRSEGSATLPGIGLGLAISAGLTAQMGGELRVESDVGKGATFSLTLPLLDPPARSPAVAS